MSIKGKFKTFLEDSKQKLLSPSEEENKITASELHLNFGERASLSCSDNEVRQFKTDPHADQEALDVLDNQYYDPEFDPSHHELVRLPETVDQQGIDAERKLLLRQLTVVSKRVFNMILESQVSCNKEMGRILAVHDDLTLSLNTCSKSRQGLNRAQQQFTSSSLGILAGCRRRQQSLQLLDNLTTIQTLRRTEERLQELLGEDNFPDAIRVLLECQKVAANYRHFAAIKQLSSKLQDTLVMSEEQLDVALAKVCVNFQKATYAKLHEAYSLLGKTQTAMDQLLMHLTSAIHNSSWNVVYGFVVLASNDAEVSKRPYPDLCQSVQREVFLPCLLDLCKSLWEIMLSYKKILDWHQTEVWSKPLSSDLSPQDPLHVEAELQRQYVQKKLESGLMRIWQDVQTKVKVYILGSDLSQFSIDSFLQVLDVIHRLMEVGQEFCGGNSEGLKESLRQHSLAYFQSYHMSRLDELRTHLENEGWALCPVKDNFSLLMLSEFSHLRSGGQKVTDSPSKNTIKSWFEAHWEQGSPFDNVCECEGGEEDILLIQDGTEGFYSDESDDDLSEDQKREIMNENTESRTTLTPLKSVPRKPVTPVIPSHKSSILISNTALMLLRLFGKYSHMIKMLPVISGEVFSGISQLFDFYVFSVHAFFASDLPEHEAPQVYSTNLKTAIKRMYSQVILHQVLESPSNSPGGEVRRNVGLVQEAGLSPGVELDNPEGLHGLSERAVAVESAVFLSGQLSQLRPYLEKSLPLAERSHLEKWYSNTVDVVKEMRSPVYMCVASRAVRSDTMIPMMGRVSWDIREVHSQHSPYVDHLLRDLQVMSSRLGSSPVPLSMEVKGVIWSLATRVASAIFVEGFAGAKKCTNEGRALMQLDYRQFVIKLEKISHVKPVPYQDFVSNYIKAYYIPEAELETWVQQHTEYSNKQLVALVNSVAYNNNKTKQKLNNIINDLSFRIRR